jgi:NTP pyrophosphatase (non-canonical NTP hydrolase)
MRRLNDLREFESENRKWLGHNFPNSTAGDQFLGVVEEVGEAAHAILKQNQGIRGKLHEEELNEAVGDILIFLTSFCNKMGWSISEILESTWEIVVKRDWVSNPETGEKFEDEDSNHARV